MGGRTAQLDHIVGPRRTSDTTTLRRGFLGTIIRFVRLYGKMKLRIISLKGERRKNGQVWRPQNDGSRTEFRKAVMTIIGEGKEENLGTIQKGIEEAAGKVPRDKMVKRTPVSVRIREEAAARCTQVVKRIVLKKQARKARADHLVICSMMPGRKRKRKQRHSEGVYADPDETREVQEKKIEYFKRKGDRQFTDDGRGAEITIDLVPAGQSKDV